MANEPITAHHVTGAQAERVGAVKINQWMRHKNSDK